MFANKTCKIIFILLTYRPIGFNCPQLRSCPQLPILIDSVNFITMLYFQYTFFNYLKSHKQNHQDTLSHHTLIIINYFDKYYINIIGKYTFAYNAMTLVKSLSCVFLLMEYDWHIACIVTPNY